MDGQLMHGHMDRRKHGNVMLLSHNLTIREGDVARLAEFCPVV